MINTDKYRNSYIMINICSTWPKEWVSFFEEHRDTIEKYNKREQEIYTIKENAKKNGCEYDVFMKNEYCDHMERLKTQFKHLILNTDKKVLCFHSSRLMQEEIEDIKNNGLASSTQSNIDRKIDNLLIYGYINKEESELIKEKQLLKNEKTPRRNNKIWFTCGNQNISYNDSSLFNVYDNYGGEIIFRALSEHLEISEKLRENSIPCLVICAVSTKDIVDCHLNKLANNILINNNDPSKIISDFYISNKNIYCLDIISPVDEDTMFDYQQDVQ